MNKPLRKANFELLRIVCMLLIIILHFLDKGGILRTPTEKFHLVNYSVYLLEAIAIISLNPYVLISGFLGYEKKGFQVKSVLKLYGQVWFYSVVIEIIALLTGLTHISELNLYTIVQFILPFSSETYWFVSAFIILMLLIPFINFGVESLSQKQLAALTVSLIIIFSVAKSVVPMKLPMDKSGYDALWMVVLYTTGAYIGKYGLKLLENKWRCLLIYLTSILLIFGSFFVCHYVYLKTGKLSGIITYSYNLNYLFVFMGSVAFLYLFSFVRIPEGRIARWIRSLAGCTFGVYLIHEHPALRYYWPTLFNATKYSNSWCYIPCTIFAVICVFLVCALIEWVRKKTAGAIVNLIKK